MIKKIISAVMVMIALIGILPFGVYATDTAEAANVIWLEDGSYIEIITQTAGTRGASTVNGTRVYTCYGSNGSVKWVAELRATFNYSGAWYTCSAANCTVTIYDSQWYVVSNNTIRSSNNAQTNLTMGRKVLGVTVEKPQYTIKLTCDNNGNLS